MIATPPKLIRRFNVVPIRIPPGFLVAIYKLILKFLWKLKESTIAETVLKTKKKLENSHFSISKLNHKETIIKTVRCWPQDWCGGQGHRTENSETSPCVCGWLTLTRMPRPFNGGRVIFPTNNVRQPDSHTSENEAGAPTLHQVQKLNKNGSETYM